MIRDDGHGCENYLECWQILKAAVDVSQELQVVGVHVHRLGPLAGLVDLGRQQVEDEGQGSGSVRLQTKHVRAATKKSPGFLLFLIDLPSGAFLPRHGWVFPPQVVHEGPHDPLGLLGGAHPDPGVVRPSFQDPDDSSKIKIFWFLIKNRCHPS